MDEVISNHSSNLIFAFLASFLEFRRFVYQEYAEKTSLRFGGEIIESNEGVQQGDPLGPFCFHLEFRTSLKIAKVNSTAGISTMAVWLEMSKQSSKMLKE